jgi:hypothetical protein
MSGQSGEGAQLMRLTLRAISSSSSSWVLCSVLKCHCPLGVDQHDRHWSIQEILESMLPCTMISALFSPRRQDDHLLENHRNFRVSARSSRPNAFLGTPRPQRPIVRPSNDLYWALPRIYMSPGDKSTPFQGFDMRSSYFAETRVIMPINRISCPFVLDLTLLLF